MEASLSRGHPDQVAQAETTVRNFGERARQIRRAELEKYGAKDESTVLDRCHAGEHMHGHVEVVRDALENLAKQGGKLGTTARILGSSASTIVEVIVFLVNPKEHERLEKDLKAHPNSSDPQKNYFDRLRTTLGTAFSQDTVTALVRALGDAFSKLGNGASSKFLRLLSAVAQNAVARAAVVGVLVLFLATAYAKTVGTASMGASFVTGLATVAVEVAATAAGAAVAAFGGIVPLLLSIGVAFAVSWAGRKVYKAVCDANSRHLWWDGFLRSLGFRSGKVPRPTWVVPDALEDRIRAEAPDLICRNTRKLLIEPAQLFGRVYERSFIEERIKEVGTDPSQPDEPVSIKDLRPCPAMRTLVLEFAKTHGLQVAMTEA